MFKSNEFAYDEKGYYLGFSFSSIIQKDRKYNLKYVLAILNSKVALDWFYKNGKIRGGGVDIGTIKLREFPIKLCSEGNQKPFIQLVDKVLFITKDEDYINNLEKQTNVKNLEKEIDKLVYELYGVTKEEIEKVENFYKKVTE